MGLVLAGFFKDIKALFANKFTAIYLVLTLPVLFLFVHDVTSRRGDLACLVALRLTCVQLINNEQIPYMDFFDWSQPVVYDLFQIPFALQALLIKLGMGTRLEDVTEAILLLLMALSSFATFSIFMYGRKRLQMLDLQDPVHKELLEQVELAVLPFALTPLLLSYFARFQFGETQYLMALALVPWIALRWLAHQSISLPKVWALLAGAVCGLAVSLEVPYAYTLLAIELLLVSIYRRYQALFSYENLGALLAVVVVWMRINQCPDAMQNAYWNWILPLRWLQFQDLDEMIQGPGAAPELAYVFYLFVLAVFASVVLGQKLKIMTLSSGLAVIGMGFFLLEKQGYTRDIILAFAGIILTLALAIAAGGQLALRSLSGKGNAIVLGQCLLALSTVVFCGYYLHQIELDYAEGINPHPRQVPLGTTDINLFVQENSKWGEPVSIICDYPDPAFPLLFNLERPPGSYLLFARPLRLLMRLQDRGLKTGHWQEFDEHIVNTLRAEFTSGRADLVLLHGAYVRDYMHARGLDKDLSDHYSEGGLATFLSDNRQPREFLGYYFSFTAWHKTQKGK